MKEGMEIEARIVMETEVIEENIKLRKKKEEISKEFQKKKVKFKTRGKITKAEQQEMKRTHRSGVFD